MGKNKKKAGSSEEIEGVSTKKKERGTEEMSIEQPWKREQE